MSLALASGIAVGDGAEVGAGKGCDAGSLVGAGDSSRSLAQATRSRAARAKASRKNLTGFVFLVVKMSWNLTSQNCRSTLHQGIALHSSR
jgi:hypothetical protein